MAEFIAPPGHTAQPAALIVSSLAHAPISIAAPDADLKEPALKASGSTITGTVAILKHIAAGSELYPAADAVAIDSWLEDLQTVEQGLKAWVEPFASQTGATDESRAQARASIEAVLTKVESALSQQQQQGRPQYVVGGHLTVADAALAPPLHALFGAVLGGRARAGLPVTTAWLQGLCGHEQVANALGSLSLLQAEEADWVAPQPKDAAGGASKKKKGKGKSAGGGAAEGGADAAGGAGAGGADEDGDKDGDGAEDDPEKAARKAAKKAEREAKKAKAQARQAEAANKAKQPSGNQDAAADGANSKKNAAKAEAEAKKAAEAAEVEKLLQEVRATPKGHKKDLGKATAAKTYNPRIVEASWYDWWEQCGFFKADASSDKPPFVIVIPPPNVTGALHIGHALTNSIQDTIVRWRRMSGYNTLWVPGTDHAGIATQTVVEKKLARERGVTRHDLGREGFLKEVWSWVGDYGGRICDQLRRLGSSVDWSRLVFTMDDARSRAVHEAFVRMYEQGAIYRDNRLVNWCCRLKTAVSDIEVDYIDIPKRTLMNVPGYTEPVEFGVLTSFAYQLEDGSGELVVATTRPETMLGDTAVAIHPQDPRYTHLHGKFLVHPVNGRRIPIICDAELVDMNFGTGAVKVTPAHDPNDFKTGKRHNLESINIFDDNGLINDQGSQFQGQPRFKARVTVVQFLKDKGLFRGTADNEMRLGLCSRSKDVIEPILKPQWWVKCDDMAARSCQAVRSGELEIIPKEFEAVWFRWLENIRDWCISRQLWWGHRIPAYYIKFTDVEDASTPGAPSEDMGRWVVGRTPADAQAQAEARYPGRQFTLAQDEDVLDTWFSSGLFPFSVFSWPDQSLDLSKFYPGALLETGHDILFFWVARMVMMGLQLTDKVPFKQVYLHAMVRDAHGRKMSKSLGNVIDPLNVIEGITLQGLHATLLGGNLDAKEAEKAKAGQTADFPDGIEECGTDALRFALCAYTSQARDINLDIKRVVAYRHWCNKLYNAIRYASLNLPDDYVPPADPTTDLQPAQLPHAAQWLLSRLSGACAAVVKAMEAYDFAAATQRVYAFWQYDLCDVYIEVMKPVMAFDDADPAKAAAKRATRDVLWTALEVGLRLLHPFMPFVTEELWQRLAKNPSAKVPESIMLAPYPGGVAAWDNAQLEADYDYLRGLITKVRNLRADYGLIKQKPKLYLSVNNAAKAEVLLRSTLEVATLTTSSEVVVVGAASPDPSSAPPRGCGVSIVDETTVAHLLLVGILDPNLELQKLEKKLEEVQRGLDAWERKVGLPGYADKTPEAVRQQDVERKARLDAEKAQVLAAQEDMRQLAAQQQQQLQAQQGQ